MNNQQIKNEIKALTEAKKSPLIRLTYLTAEPAEKYVLITEEDLDILISKRKMML